MHAGQFTISILVDSSFVWDFTVEFLIRLNTLNTAIAGGIYGTLDKYCNRGYESTPNKKQNF